MTTKTIVDLREKVGKAIRCIELGKLNMATLYLLKIDDVLKEVKVPREEEFSVGYFCAVANMMRDHKDDVIARDCLAANFATTQRMRELGVDEEDIKILKDIVSEVQRRE